MHHECMTVLHTEKVTRLLLVGANIIYTPINNVMPHLQARVGATVTYTPINNVMHHLQARVGTQRFCTKKLAMYSP